MNDNELNRLETIAQAYHLNDKNHPDIFIENTCQEYELTWIGKQLKNAKSILELGYGDGIVTDYLVKNNHKLTLIEGSHLLCEKVKYLYQDKIHLKKTLFETFDTNSKYDFILASHVLEHIEYPVKLLSKYKNFLNKNGKILIIVPNCHSLHRQLGVAMNLHHNLDDLTERDILVGHRRVYSFDLLKQHVENSGLVINKRKGFFIKLLPNKFMLNLSKEHIIALNKISENLPPDLLANIAVIVNKK